MLLSAVVAQEPKEVKAKKSEEVINTLTGDDSGWRSLQRQQKSSHYPIAVDFPKL